MSFIKSNKVFVVIFVMLSLLVVGAATWKKTKKDDEKTGKINNIFHVSSVMERGISCYAISYPENIVTIDKKLVTIKYDVKLTVKPGGKIHKVLWASWKGKKFGEFSAMELHLYKTPDVEDIINYAKTQKGYPFEFSATANKFELSKFAEEKGYTCHFGEPIRPGDWYIVRTNFYNKSGVIEPIIRKCKQILETSVLSVEGTDPMYAFSECIKVTNNH